MIALGGEKKEFHFIRVNQADIHFHISVLDDNGKLVQATLARDLNSEWKLTSDELPNWIKEAEPAIIEAVKEQE